MPPAAPPPAAPPPTALRVARAARLLFAATLAAALLAGCGFATPSAEPAAAPGTATEAVVYRSAACECCEGHVAHLRAEGFAVRSVVVDDVAEVKADLGVPDELASCHTTVVGGYFVEGHVPADVIDELLAARPPVDGIALPGMPAGSPGMPGAQTEPLVIHAVAAGQASVFATR